MTRQKIVFGLLFVVLGAALFVTASAYCVDHSYGKIAAAVVGGFAFPLAPVLWHAIGERRRRAKIAAAKSPPKTTLTGYDRYWLRFVVVALAVLAPMVAASRFGVLSSVWRQGFWFLPAEPQVAVNESLLRRVPGDAELVVFVHDKGDKQRPAASGVFAWGAHQAMIAADEALADRKSKDRAAEIKQLNEWAKAVPELLAAPLAEVKTSDGKVVVASEGWRGKVEPAGAGPGAELRAELGRAPADVTFVAAFAPRTKLTALDIEPDTIKHGVVWATYRDDSITAGARVEMKDEAEATKLVLELEAVLHFQTKGIPEGCKDAVGKIVDKIKLSADGAIVNAHVELPNDALVSLMFCGMTK